MNPILSRLGKVRLRRSRRAQRWALVVVASTILGASCWVQRRYEHLAGYPDRPGVGSTDSVSLEIPRGASFTQTLGLLVQHGVIPEDEALYFKLFVMHKGASSRITAGKHSFTARMTPSEILEELQRRQPVQEVKVTIPEGKNMREIAEILATAGFGEVASLEASMRDPKLLQELGLSADSLEGYLFPDTYKLARTATPTDVLRRLVARHRQVFEGLRRRYRHEAEDLQHDLGWDSHQIVILASIVEKETKAEHERPVIAGVFLNRLKFSNFKPKLLQTDPTIVYGCTMALPRSPACEKFEGRIRTIHLRDPDNPYNTYTHEGLPPGPIANPGRAALEAVLSPKKSRFLYFVARNDGTHQFSKTEAEHEQWVDMYQRKGAVGDGSAAGAADP